MTTDKPSPALAEALETEINEKYSQGYCMFLAVALKRLFNYEIQACIETDVAGEYIAHAWAVLPNGNILDIDGEYPESMNAYDGKVWGKRVNNLSETQLKTYLPTQDRYERDVLEAMKVVRDYLLPKYRFSEKFQGKYLRTPVVEP